MPAAGSARSVGRTGILVVAAVLIGMLNPRAMATLVPVLMAIVAVPALMAAARPAPSSVAGGNEAAGLPFLLGQGAWIFLLLFAAWGMVSAAWSLAPGSSIAKSAYLALLVVLLFGVARWCETADADLAGEASIGLFVAVAVLALVLAIEVATNQAMTRFILNAFPFLRPTDSKHVQVAANGLVVNLTEAELNRKTAILMLMLWPTALIGYLLYAKRLGRGERRAWLLGLSVISAAAAFIAVGFGKHQSSQFALVMSAVFFLVSRFKPRVGFGIAAVVWSGLVLAMIPLAISAYAMKVHEASWLFHSARHRIVIWHETAQQAIASPWIGIGADATPVANKNLQNNPVRREGEFDVAVGRHAHNAYLQAWYELGGVGALFVLVAGLSIIWAISALPQWLAPYALAQLATTAVLMSASYGLWQMWIMASAIAGAGFMMLAVGIARDDGLTVSRSDER